MQDQYMRIKGHSYAGEPKTDSSGRTQKPCIDKLIAKMKSEVNKKVNKATKGVAHLQMARAETDRSDKKDYFKKRKPGECLDSFAWIMNEKGEKVMYSNPEFVVNQTMAKLGVSEGKLEGWPEGESLLLGLTARYLE